MTYHLVPTTPTQTTFGELKAGHLCSVSDGNVFRKPMTTSCGIIVNGKSRCLAICLSSSDAGWYEITHLPTDYPVTDLGPHEWRQK